MRLVLAMIICFTGIPHAGFAKPIAYNIIIEKSVIGFTYQFGADTISGAFPQYSATISIDFETASNSRVVVVLNAAKAKAGFVFATQALRSKKILNTSEFPNITFVSQSVRATKGGAQIKGLITVRGISRPVILTARLTRALGTLASERDNLHLYLSGEINRHDFGASGWPNYVGDILAIRINAYIRRK
jgi:polyisoprenoid-binding protein YceI